MIALKISNNIIVRYEKYYKISKENKALTFLTLGIFKNLLKIIGSLYQYVSTSTSDNMINNNSGTMEVCPQNKQF